MPSEPRVPFNVQSKPASCPLCGEQYTFGHTCPDYRVVVTIQNKNGGMIEEKVIARGNNLETVKQVFNKLPSA